jgi:flagellar basal body-associated protein FliL
MPRGNAINPLDRPSLLRRRLLGLLAAGSLLLPATAYAQEKEKKKKSDTPVEKPPINNPVLVVDAVTAPIAGPPGSKVIMTLNIDCGSVENARKVDDLMPRVYNAIIIELNREPLGKDGRLFDQDIEQLKRRLVYQINRQLQGPQVVGVYVRSLQEVPLRPPPRS